MDQDGSSGGGEKWSNSINILKAELTQLLTDWMWYVEKRREVPRAPKNGIAVDYNGEDLERIKEFSPNMLYWLDLLLI